MTGGCDRIVVVGASLAGLSAARTLRSSGFDGELVIVGEEVHGPYDRPPLSKQVAIGMVDAGETSLPFVGSLNAHWKLGVRATALDVESRSLTLSDGKGISFDRLLIATGTRARPWADASERALRSVLTLRTKEDAAVLRTTLACGPRHVAVIGGGFTGSEIASACRELSLPVTLVERGETPLAGALGCVVGRAAASLQRAHGVDLRCGTSVDRLEGDASGRVRRVHMMDGHDPVDADLVVIALGSVPNVEWLDGSGLAVGARGAACDAACRAYNKYGIAQDAVYVAGDVARFPHPLFNFEFMTLEHWSNAVNGGAIAARNMLASSDRLVPHLDVPAFWSSQFDVSIKSVGVPAAADQVMFVQGSPDEGRFAAVYGKHGRLVAAVGFDHGKWLQQYADLIRAGADFPCGPGMDAPPQGGPVAAEFPSRSRGGLQAYITLSGHQPDDRDGTLHLGRDEDAPGKSSAARQERAA